MIGFQLVSVGSHRFAIPESAVRDRLMGQKPTPVPRTPPHMLGVIIWQGQVSLVVSCGERLGIDYAGAGYELRELLGVDVGGEIAFIEVDSIEATVGDVELEPSDAISPFVAGVIVLGGERIPVLRLEAVVRAADL